MKKLLISALTAAVVLSSCSKNLHAPALYQHDVSYMPKPSSFDSVKNATFVSLGGAFNTGVDINDVVTFAELNISRGHAFKNTNLAYGVYGFAGSIENSYYSTSQTFDPNRLTSKSFYGYGARASFNLYKVMDNVNFRYLGIEGHYSKEVGPYADYRRTVNGLPDYNVITRTDLITLGATSEVFWHTKADPSVRHSIRVFSGRTFGDFSAIDDYTTKINYPFYLSASYCLNVKQVWLVTEITKNDYSIPSARLKIGYRF